MKITALTKFKHGVLFNAMKQLGWSQNRLAKEAGINNCVIGTICNLKSRPTIKTANAIQNAFGKHGVYIDVTEAWPETFKGFARTVTIEETQEVEILKLEAEQEFSRRIALNFNGSIDSERFELLNKCFKTLDEKEKKVIELRFLENSKTLETVGEEIGCTRERVRQLQMSGLRKLNRKMESAEAFEDIYS